MAAPHLPYKMLAGVVPCPGGWLIVPARLAGVTVVAEDPMVVPMLLDVLEFKPKFDACAIAVPIGFSDEPAGPYRPCDLEAREIIGWPRRTSVHHTPSRAALHAASRDEALALEPWLTREDFRRFKWIREAEREFQPFHQRSFFAANPDLTYTQLHGDIPLRTSPHHEDGIRERMLLLRDKMPGVDEVMTSVPPPGAGLVHLVQAAGLLWTARRAAGRAMHRLPLDPEWDSTGMRMELVR